MSGRVAPFVGKFAKFVRVVITTVRKLDKIKHVRVAWYLLFHVGECIVLVGNCSSFNTVLQVTRDSVSFLMVICVLNH